VYVGNISHEELGSTMHKIATDPLIFVLYLIGVLAATFHFANGLWAFLISWGITVGERAQRISSKICMGVFVVVAVLFILSLVGFRGNEFKEVADAVMAVRSIL